MGEESIDELFAELEAHPKVNCFVRKNFLLFVDEETTINKSKTRIIIFLVLEVYTLDYFGL